jgi:N-acetylmuramoyl-L-alanine amidase
MGSSAPIPRGGYVVTITVHVNLSTTRRYPGNSTYFYKNKCSAEMKKQEMIAASFRGV